MVPFGRSPYENGVSNGIQNLISLGAPGAEIPLVFTDFGGYFGAPKTIKFQEGMQTTEHASSRPIEQSMLVREPRCNLRDGGYFRPIEAVVGLAASTGNKLGNDGKCSASRVLGFEKVSKAFCQ